MRRLAGVAKILLRKSGRLRGATAGIASEFAYTFATREMACHP